MCVPTEAEEFVRVHLRLRANNSARAHFLKCHTCQERAPANLVNCPISSSRRRPSQHAGNNGKGSWAARERLCRALRALINQVTIISRLEACTRSWKFANSNGIVFSAGCLSAAASSKAADRPTARQKRRRHFKLRVAYSWSINQLVFRLIFFPF